MVDKLLESHKIIVKDNRHLILVNKPANIVHDIDNIVVVYSGEDVKISSKKIPDSIRKNMARYFDGDIYKYLLFLESNLETFLSGKTPDWELYSSKLTDKRKPCKNSELSGEKSLYKGHSLDNSSTYSEDTYCKRTSNELSSEVTDYNQEDTDYSDDREYSNYSDDKLDVFPTNASMDKSNKVDSKQKLRRIGSDFTFPIQNNLTLNLYASIETKNIGLLSCTSLNAQLQCNRCSLITSLQSSGNCVGCKSHIELSYTSTLYRDDYLGFFRVTNASVVCFNLSTFVISCGTCLSVYELVCGIGSSVIERCFVCFAELKFILNDIQFRQRVNYKLSNGNPLPDFGACRHYKKSYRWFRFPCCKSLYPCDICHDQRSSHKHELATRMVCGKCSKEQSVKNECSCGMNLSKKSSKFWEGGKGNRNRNTMSKKDSKKYRK